MTGVVSASDVDRQIPKLDRDGPFQMHSPPPKDTLKHSPKVQVVITPSKTWVPGDAISNTSCNNRFSESNILSRTSRDRASLSIERESPGVASTIPRSLKCPASLKTSSPIDSAQETLGAEDENTEVSVRPKKRHRTSHTVSAYFNYFPGVDPKLSRKAMSQNRDSTGKFLPGSKIKGRKSSSRGPSKPSVSKEETPISQEYNSFKTTPRARDKTGEFSNSKARSSLACLQNEQDLTTPSPPGNHSVKDIIKLGLPQQHESSVDKVQEITPTNTFLGDKIHIRQEFLSTQGKQQVRDERGGFSSAKSKSRSSSVILQPKEAINSLKPFGYGSIHRNERDMNTPTPSGNILVQGDQGVSQAYNHEAVNFATLARDETSTLREYISIKAKHQVRDKTIKFVISDTKYQSKTNANPPQEEYKDDTAARLVVNQPAEHVNDVSSFELGPEPSPIENDANKGNETPTIPRKVSRDRAQMYQAPSAWASQQSHDKSNNFSNSSKPTSKLKTTIDLTQREELDTSSKLPQSIEHAANCSQTLESPGSSETSPERPLKSKIPEHLHAQARSGGHNKPSNTQGIPPLSPPKSTTLHGEISTVITERRSASDIQKAYDAMTGSRKAAAEVTKLLHDAFIDNYLSTANLNLQPSSLSQRNSQDVPLSRAITESSVVQGEGEFEAEVKERARRSKRSKAPVVSPFFTPASTPTKLAKFSRIDPSPTTDEAEFVTPKSTTGNPQTTGGTVSCIPFPPLANPTFGLIQERLANNPFRLLIAVTFLIKTRGKDAIPVYFELMNKYPTPEALATASKEDIVPIIHHLGLQNQRAGTYQTYGKIWIENPPVKDKRYPVRGYPNPDSGRGIKRDEILDDADERDAWEIGHMTQGSYSLDSWRIFCRDKLRGVARSWNGEGTESGFQPEWMRVLPEDKELRAFLRWMWLKEGFDWDPLTGEKEVASPDLMRAAIEGKISWDERSGIRIMDSEIKDAPTVIAAEQQ